MDEINKEALLDFVAEMLSRAYGGEVPMDVQFDLERLEQMINNALIHRSVEYGLD